MVATIDVALDIRLGQRVVPHHAQGGSGCRWVSGEGLVSGFGLVSEGLVSRAGLTGSRSKQLWHIVVHTPTLLEHALMRRGIGAGHHSAQRDPRGAPQNYSVPNAAVRPGPVDTSLFSKQSEGGNSSPAR